MNNGDALVLVSLYPYALRSRTFWHSFPTALDDDVEIFGKAFWIKVPADRSHPHLLRQCKVSIEDISSYFENSGKTFNGYELVG